MALDVLIKEVGVEKLSIGPCAKHLVVSLPLVQEFMAPDGIETAEHAPVEHKQEVLPIGLRFKLEPVVINVDLITHDNQRPNPCQRFKSVKHVEGDPKSLVIVENSLTFQRKVLIVTHTEKEVYYGRQIDKPEGQQHVSSVGIDDVSDENDPGKAEVWVHISHEFGSFLNDQNYSALSSAFDQSPVFGVDCSSFGVIFLQILASSVWHFSFLIKF